MEIWDGGKLLFEFVGSERLNYRGMNDFGFVKKSETKSVSEAKQLRIKVSMTIDRVFDVEGHEVPASEWRAVGIIY